MTTSQNNLNETSTRVNNKLRNFDPDAVAQVDRIVDLTSNLEQIPRSQIFGMLLNSQAYRIAIQTAERALDEHLSGRAYTGKRLEYFEGNIDSASSLIQLAGNFVPEQYRPNPESLVRTLDSVFESLRSKYLESAAVANNITTDGALDCAFDESDFMGESEKEAFENLEAGQVFEITEKELEAHRRETRARYAQALEDIQKAASKEAVSRIMAASARIKTLEMDTEDGIDSLVGCNVINLDVFQCQKILEIVHNKAQKMGKETVKRRKLVMQGDPIAVNKYAWLFEGIQGEKTAADQLMLRDVFVESGKAYKAVASMIDNRSSNTERDIDSGDSSRESHNVSDDPRFEENHRVNLG